MDNANGDGSWTWLMAHDEGMLDYAWCGLLQNHWRALKVPVESRAAVLEAGIKY